MTVKSRIGQYFQDKYLAGYLVVFLAYFLSARLGQYIFIDLNSPPAVIWPPSGIALGAVFLGGYRMWVPIFLANFLAVFIEFKIPGFALFTALASALQPVIGVYILHRFGFRGKLTGIRDAIVLVVSSLFIATIATTIITAAQSLFDIIPAPALLVWARAWGGRVFSILILFPLITTWYPWESARCKTRDRVEIVAAFILLVANNYLLFWTSYPAVLGIIVIFFLPAVLIWFALRFNPRWMTLAVFITSVEGIMGTIIAHPSAQITIAQQLFSDEIYLAFVAAIFYILVAVVSERRKAGETLIEQNRQLTAALAEVSAANQAKIHFIATLAHELRNPLAPIVSSLELMKMKINAENRADLRETVTVATTHLATIAHLLEDLLDITRITQKKLHLKKEVVEVQSVIYHCLETIDSFYKSKHLVLSLRLPKEPLWMEADPIRLGQIFTNLLFNAGKYTNPRGRITVSAEKKESNIVVRVSDTGIGVPLEMQSKIFEPFVQSHQAAVAGTGLGIGLSLTKWLVEMHGGKISVSSEGKDKGSEFTVELPAIPALEPHMIEEPAPARKGPVFPLQLTNTPVIPTGGKKVLVVDDNEAAANGLQKLLEHNGHKTSVAYTGVEAEKKVVEFDPHAVLLDIGLPDISGYDVAKGLRKKYPSLYLIALTGYGMEEDKIKAMHAGFDYHLTKPISIADVEAILGKLTHRPPTLTT